MRSVDAIGLVDDDEKIVIGQLMVQKEGSSEFIRSRPAAQFRAYVIEDSSLHFQDRRVSYFSNRQRPSELKNNRLFPNRIVDRT